MLKKKKKRGPPIDIIGKCSINKPCDYTVHLAKMSPETDTGSQT